MNGNHILESLMVTLAFFLWEEEGVWFVIRGVVCSMNEYIVMQSLSKCLRLDV